MNQVYHSPSGEVTMSGQLSYLGIIPSMLSMHDPRPMTEQLHEGYAHGGGWQPFDGFDVQCKGGVYSLHYPDDPAMVERARIEMHGETLCVFDYAWVLVIDKDGCTHVCRMD